MGEIFGFGGKKVDKSFQDTLNNKACGDEAKEEEIALVARHKCFVYIQSKKG